MMKAVRMYEYGGPEVLKYENVLIPDMTANELLIRINAAGVNPVDWKIRLGLYKHSLPTILGCDFSGEVAAVGADVSSFRQGDVVFGMMDISRNGCYAQYAVARENELALKPKSLTDTEAAVVPLSALTAWQALIEHANLQPGQKVLIHAAAGGVGHFAVQIAKSRGAFVIGTASTKNISFLKEFGVDEIIDYTKTPFDQAVSQVDVVLDTIGGEVRTRSWSVLKEDGVLVTLVDREQIKEEAKQYHRKGIAFVVTPNAKQLEEIVKLINEGKLRPFLTQTFALADAAKAHELSESKHVHGKIALVIP